MPIISLKAHFDGTAIQLDEPYELPQDAKLLVTILPSAAAYEGSIAWAELSSAGLSNAYGENEPAYSADDVLP